MAVWRNGRWVGRYSADIRVHGKKTNMKVLFGKYAMEKSYDIYQYYNIDPLTDYKKIFKNIVYDLKNGSEI